jgi:hypothetical protein
VRKRVGGSRPMKCFDTSRVGSATTVLFCDVIKKS